MGGVRKLAVLLLALACAAALAACGSGSSTDTTTGTTAQATTGTTTGGEGGSGAGKESQPEGSGGGKSSEKKGEGSGGGSGSSSKERSSSFRTPGGDNSIQEFGAEAGAEERAKATKTLTVFFSAGKAEEWAKVCGVLGAKALAQMNEFSKQSPKLKGKNCAGVIKLVYSSASSTSRPESIKGGVISLRREGEQSFALYHGADGKDYAFPMVLENGEWKLIGLGATPLGEP
jgi:hypothetical protein